CAFHSRLSRDLTVCFDTSTFHRRRSQTEPKLICNRKTYNQEAHNREAFNHEAHNPEAFNHEAHNHKAFNHEAHNREAFNHEAHTREAFNHEAHNRVAFKPNKRCICPFGDDSVK
ncbi:hypothetical protein LSAT2_022915, partial [Lamellibrachia satsuma]